MSIDKRFLSTGEAPEYYGGEASWDNGSSYASVSRTLGFEPDMIWVTGKASSQTNTGGGESNHPFIFDRDFFGTEFFVRDTSQYIFRSSASNVIDWNSNGFGFNYVTESGTDASIGYNILYPNTKFTAICFKTSSSSITNTSGNISATEYCNTDAKISKLHITAGGSGQTVGHSLGVSPQWVIAIRLDSGWSSISGNSSTGARGSSARYDTNSNCWVGVKGSCFDSVDNTCANTTNFSANSSTITLGSDTESGGSSSYEYIFYLFADSSGFSKLECFQTNESTALRTVWSDCFQPKCSFIFGRNNMYQLDFGLANFSTYNTISGTTYTLNRVKRITNIFVGDAGVGTGEYLQTTATEVKYATNYSDLNWTTRNTAIMAFGGDKWNATFS